MLVNCVVYENGRKLADIPVEQISEHVGKPDRLVWVALFEPDEAELELMREEFGLHELAFEDALKGQQRPKIEEYGSTLYAVMQTIDADAQGAQGFAIGEVHVFAAPTYVLSIRRRTRHGFATVRARCEREPENLANGPGYVLYAIMDEVVDRYVPVIEELERNLETLEVEIFRSTPTRASIEAFYDLKYELMLVKHAVAPLMDAVSRLMGGRVPAVVVGLQDYFRDIYDHLVRVNASIDATRDMQQAATQVSLSLIGLSESETTKRLAAWGALITVPTLIAGIYGMNFAHMPELGWKLGYPVALALMCGVDAWLYTQFRRAGWL